MIFKGSIYGIFKRHPKTLHHSYYINDTILIQLDIYLWPKFIVDTNQIQSVYSVKLILQSNNNSQKIYILYSFMQFQSQKMTILDFLNSYPF